jgi:hypothetical protein
MKIWQITQQSLKNGKRNANLSSEYLRRVAPKEKDNLDGYKFFLPGEKK